MQAFVAGQEINATPWLAPRPTLHTSWGTLTDFRGRSFWKGETLEIDFSVNFIDENVGL